jgi:cytochrome P450
MRGVRGLASGGIMADPIARTWRAPLHGARAHLGGVRGYLHDPLTFFLAHADDSGRAVPCPLLGDGCLLNGPDDIGHVLARNAPNYVKSRRVAGPRATYPPPYTLLTSHGPDHRRRRRAMQPIFRAIGAKIVERTRVNTERLAASLRDGERIDATEAMTVLAQRSLLEALLGTGADDSIDRMAAALRARWQAFEGHFLSLFPAPQALPSGRNREWASATVALRSAIDAEIADRRDRPRLGADVLSLLMTVTDEDARPLTDREVRDEAMSISLTGYDSVTQALQWTFYLVGRHAEVDARIAEEAITAGAAPAARPYAMSVIRESLRLFPPTWLLVRIARAADRLPSGATIAAGAKVYVSPYVVQRNPTVWPEPERFDPGRFAPGAGNRRSRYAYLPFGGGPHVCIGEAVAVPQIAQVLAGMVAHHRLVPSRACDAVPFAGLTLRPSGALEMRVEARA